MMKIEVNNKVLVRGKLGNKHNKHIHMPKWGAIQEKREILVTILRNVEI